MINFQALRGQIVALPGLFRYWQRHPISSRNLLGTFLRFVRWQIGARAVGATVLWPWIGSTRLAINPGMTGATMNVYCGLHEFNDMAFLLHFLRAEDRFVDVGANVGAYSILASGVAGARSLTVEPIPTTFQRLLLNLSINDLHAKVQTEMCGVGSEQGTLKFIADQDTTNRVAPEGYAGATTDVPVRTLDFLLENFAAVLWKVDVEGFEDAVLAGAKSALQQKTLVAVEMEGDSATIREVMRGAGFRLFHYDPFARSLTASEDEPSGHNFLWIRDIEFVTKRCKSGPRFNIRGVQF